MGAAGRWVTGGGRALVAEVAGGQALVVDLGPGGRSGRPGSRLRGPARLAATGPDQRRWRDDVDRDPTPERAAQRDDRGARGGPAEPLRRDYLRHVRERP